MLTGVVVLPDSKEYDQARLVSNYYTSKNSRPDAIVYCKSTADVQNAVKWALCKKLPIRIRSGGHNHEGFSSGKGLVIDVSRMKNVEVDSKTHIATIQPGITGGELYKHLYEKGLTQVGGTCGDVGISGLVLTGGMGPLMRHHGLTCDTLLSLEMVNAKGEVITVTKDNEYKDLFWACQGGGGGNFGVVTSIKLQTYPANKVTWFNIGWDWGQPFEEVVTKWQELFNNDDKKWFSHIDIWAKPFPDKKLMKQPLKVLGVYYGTPEQAKKDLEPFLKIGQPRDQTIESVEWVQAIRNFEDATAVYLTDKPEYKSSGAYAMKPLPQEALKIVLDTLEKTDTPLLNVLLFSMGGASAEVKPTETAYYYRKAPFFVVYSTQWLKPEEDKVKIAELDTLRTKLLPYTEGDYIGNPDRSLSNYLKVYFGDNVERLRCIKRKYDPHSVFQFEQGVTPALNDKESCHEN
ncbi:MAG: FAD-binding oxidoreductase [Parachlamydiaceae bacterium]